MRNSSGWCSPRQAARLLRYAVRISLTLCIALASADDALAQQVSSHFDSIEWMTASSELIARGTISQISSEKDDDVNWQSVEFQVDEMLKGAKRTTVRFMVEGSGRNSLEDWRATHRSVIVFLRPSRSVAARQAGWNGLFGRRYLRFPYAPRTGYAEGSFLDLTAKPETAAYSLTMQRLQTADEFVPAIQNAIAATADNEPVERCVVYLPGRDKRDTLTVPVDTRLETAAQQWVKSKEMELRVQGVTALVYFQSPDNADLLKPLLDDPGYVDEVVAKRNRPAELTRIYLVRQLAYHVLQTWGFEVPQPIIQEAVPASKK